MPSLNRLRRQTRTLRLPTARQTRTFWTNLATHHPPWPLRKLRRRLRPAILHLTPTGAPTTASSALNSLIPSARLAPSLAAALVSPARALRIRCLRLLCLVSARGRGRYQGRRHLAR